jgi:hypothetical protein
VDSPRTVVELITSKTHSVWLNDKKLQRGADQMGGSTHSSTEKSNYFSIREKWRMNKSRESNCTREKSSGDMDKRERGMHVYSSWIKREANEKNDYSSCV